MNRAELAALLGIEVGADTDEGFSARASAALVALRTVHPAPDPQPEPSLDLAAADLRTSTLQEQVTRLEPERDALADRITTVIAANDDRLAIAVAETLRDTVTDHLIDGAYRDGKLVYTRGEEGEALPSRFEPQLRSLAASSGVDVLREELDGMPQRVPIGKRPLDLAKEPPKYDDPGLDGLTTDEHAIADQLGLDPADILDTKHRNQEFRR